MRQGSYPTPAQVSLFLEEVWIDDAYRVEFRKQNPKTPLYGYDEKYFSNVAEGQVIVSGNIVITYRYPGYLWHIIAKRETEIDPTVGAYVNLAADILRANPNQRIEMIREARQKGNLEKVSSVMQRILGTRNWGSPPKALDLVNDTLKEPFGKYKPFNVKIYFDKPQSAWYHTQIEDVHFTGSSMTLSASGTYGGDSSASGQPIFEVYSFFAKDVVQKYSQQPTLTITDNEVGGPDGPIESAEKSGPWDRITLPQIEGSVYT